MINDSLWTKVINTSENAIISGSLKPFKTKLDKLIHQDCIYELRSIIGKPRTQNIINGPKTNPFSPWDKKLEVVKILDDHVLILNKFPVELGHMLLITNTWKAQEGWLSKKDWHALVSIENQISGFWFFNNSINAGASQPHRHLQLLRRENSKLLFPRQYWFENRKDKYNLDISNLDRSCLVLGRKCYKKEDSADELENLYLRLCDEMKLGIPSFNEKPTCAYNLIITSKWIALIRRLKESYKGFSINALGFAGYFLVTRESDIKWLKVNHPPSILNKVVSPI